MARRSAGILNPVRNLCLFYSCRLPAARDHQSLWVIDAVRRRGSWICKNHPHRDQILARIKNSVFDEPSEANGRGTEGGPASKFVLVSRRLPPPPSCPIPSIPVALVFSRSMNRMEIFFRFSLSLLSEPTTVVPGGGTNGGDV